MSLNFNSFNTLSLALVSSLALTVTLTACGGSSSSSGSDSSNTGASSSNTKSSSESTSNPQELDCTEISEQAMLDAINEIRAQGRSCSNKGETTFYPAAGKLIWNLLLAKSASDYATDMAANNYYYANHLDNNGNDYKGRIKATGYGLGKQYAMGENIASGQATLDGVMQAWLTSTKGHCDTIMRAEIKDFGMACGYNSNSKYKSYWVQSFGVIQ